MAEERNARGVFVVGYTIPNEVRNKIARTLNKTGDLIGRHFGSWVVLEKRETRGGVRYWLCRCDCGTEKEVGQRTLASGRSTGCLKCSGKKSRSRASARCVLLNGRIQYRSNGAQRSFYWSAIRKEQFNKQKGLCPICSQLLSSEKEPFDRDHENGLCREIVHRGCNILIAFVENHPEMIERARNYIANYKIGEGRVHGTGSGC
jgi:hypothetical protein